MELLARRKFQHKIGISFAMLIGMIAINALVAGLATYSITNKAERQKAIEEIIRDLVKTRLVVSSFNNSLDRRLSEQVLNEIALTRQQIEAAVSVHSDRKLSALLSQLDDFKARFQKYMVEADQMAALESRALSQGHELLDQLNAVRMDRDDFFAHLAFDRVIGRVVNIIWQGQELQSRLHRPTAKQLSKIKAELKELKALSQKADDIDMQRFLFRIIRDTRDYVTSFEKHLRYKALNATTERALFQISAQIQADCDQISSDMEATIRRHIGLAITITLMIFLITLITAPVLARYLTGEILKPVLSLVAITKDVAAGHLDVRANVEVEDDIGQLSYYFNRMTKSLKRSQEQLLEKNRALEETHDELEQRVRLRTQELAITNASLHSEIAIRKQSEEEIRASEEKFRAMFEMSPLGIARNSLDGFFLEANHALQAMLGYNLVSLQQRRFSDLYVETPIINWAEFISSLQETRHYSLRDVCIKSRDGQARFMRLNGVLVTESDGQESLWSICEDITEQKRSEEVIWKQANFDTLTGLPNRRMFQNNLDHEIKNSKRQSRLLALMFLDLDKFKEVNDTLGHDKGDLLLIEAAQRIANCVRETDMVARLGGDEFTVILPNLAKTNNVERVAGNIVETLSQPFDLAGSRVFIGVSIGITIYPNDATSLDELMIQADQAMYQAKAEGRNRFCYFTRSLQVSSRKRARLINDMRKAVSDEQFELYYQPVVELASGDIRKAEALIRWHHPDLGLISPSEFIPLAEETGMIAEIGDWVFREAARQVKYLRCSYHPQFQISINKSPLHFSAAQPYTDDWIAFLASIDLCKDAIIIEITEGLLLDPSDIVKSRLLQCRDAGFQISLDDFGTGYSSLAYLNRFDIDHLKIDQAFINNLTPESDELALCEAITVMAHKLGLEVIAEGVTTPLQRDLLLATGCDYAQGFLYSIPLPAEAFEHFLFSDKQRLCGS
ncbi:MAG: EAL domain-containing protein [Candidatus Thiodiazotropha sp.]|jgi:diguanylate cyclase (GGDEF)-like protein/PAS domain S-box-containing protein